MLPIDAFGDENLSWTYNLLFDNNDAIAYLSSIFACYDCHKDASIGGDGKEAVAGRFCLSPQLFVKTAQDGTWPGIEC